MTKIPERWLVTTLGARMHYAVPRMLHEAGMLEHFYTDICAVKGWPQLLRFMPENLLPTALRRLKARVPVGIPTSRVTAFTTFGLEYARRQRRAANISEIMAVHLWAGTRFNELVLSRGFGQAGVIYGFNSASEVLFAGAKAAGLACVLEQSSAPRTIERQFMVEVTEQFPGWKDNKLMDQCGDAFAEREQNEWRLADRILCPSHFVKKAMLQCGVPEVKCMVVPYGVAPPSRLQAGITASSENAPSPLTVLFVGRVNLQKGVPYLLAAMRRLNGRAIHCRLVGSLGIDRELLEPMLPANVEVVGALPRSMMAAEYSRADVFCLPSICEGSATVIYEALAAGLPVVTTENAGSIVRDGVEGFIVPIRDSEALADRIGLLASDQAMRAGMSQAALARSAYGSLAGYGQRLVEALNLQSDLC